MRKLWIAAGVLLILIGLASLSATNGTIGKKLQPFEKQWRFSAGELRVLNIQSYSRVEVTFVKSVDGSNGIYLKGRGRENLIEQAQNIELADGKLDLDLREPLKTWMNLFNFNFGFNRGTAEIVVSLSDGKELEHLGVKLTSGFLKVSDARVKTAELGTNSGSIEINDLTADRLDVKVNSGSIKGSGIHADSAFESNSGSIKLERLSGPARLDSDSGSIKVYKEDTADTDIRASSGSVYVHLPASFAGSFDLQANSGSIHAPNDKRETKDVVKVRTRSGSIKIEQG